MDHISKSKAMMIMAQQMRVLPRDKKEDRVMSLEHQQDGFDSYRLALTLYEDFYCSPYCQPEFASLMTRQDVKNCKRFKIIFRGVRGYAEASETDRKAFRENVFRRASLTAMARYYWHLKRDDLERA